MTVSPFRFISFKDTANPDFQKDGMKAIEKETAQNLRSIMESTVLAGTAPMPSNAAV